MQLSMKQPQISFQWLVLALKMVYTWLGNFTVCSKFYCYLGSSSEGNQISTASITVVEGDARGEQRQGGAAGVQGDAGAGPGHHEPGDGQGHRDHEVVAEDLDDQHALQTEWEPVGLAGLHHLGGQKGEL